MSISFIASCIGFKQLPHGVGQFLSHEQRRQFAGVQPAEFSEPQLSKGNRSACRGRSCCGLRRSRRGFRRGPDISSRTTSSAVSTNCVLAVANQAKQSGRRLAKRPARHHRVVAAPAQWAVKSKPPESGDSTTMASWRSQPRDNAVAGEVSFTFCFDCEWSSRPALLRGRGCRAPRPYAVRALRRAADWPAPRRSARLPRGPPLAPCNVDA